MIRIWGKFILVLLGMISLKLPAQYTQPPYRHFTLRDGLPQMQVNYIFQDSRGYIWICTKGGLCRYNGEKFTNFYEKDGLISNFIFHVGEDHQGNIWINSQGGLTMFDGVRFHPFPAENMNNMPFDTDVDGRLWFSGIKEGELICGYLFEGEYHYFPPLIMDFSDIAFQSVFWSEEDNNVYINAGNQLFEFNKEGARLIYTFPEKVIMSKTPGGIIHFLSHSGSEDVMLYTLEEGKIAMTGHYKHSKSFGINRLEHPFYVEYNNSSPNLYVTGEALIPENLYGIQKNVSLVDRDGQSWIGSEEGLYLILDNGFETYRSEYFPQVWSVVEDLKGNIWTASFHFGLKKFDGKKIQSFPHLKDEGLGEYFHFGSSADDKGRLYFPNSKGLLEYNGTFRKITDTPMLTSFHDPQTGFIWGGTQGEVHVFDRNRDLTRTIGSGDGLDMKRWITCMGVDRQGWHWIGSFAGAVRYHYKTREIYSYNRKNGRLPDDGIMSVHTDEYGTTWFAGTNGLLYYDSVKDSIFRVQHEDLTETVSFVSSIDSTWLLFSQPVGIYLMSLPDFHKDRRLKLNLFNDNNGYMGIEPGQDGAYKDSKGHFWITSGSGLVKLDPSRLRLFTHSVGIRFTSCNTKNLPFILPAITLEPNQRNATVSFEAICFNRPTPVQYSWRLENGKKEWSPWQEENYAVIPRLPSGNSTLLLRARVRGLSLDTYEYASLNIRTIIPLWRQDWFFPALFGLFAMIGLLALVLLYRTRIQMVRATRDARISQVQAIQSQMNPHFIFNVLASVQSMILNQDMGKANFYLVKLSGLVRGFLDASVSTGFYRNTDQQEIMYPLSRELEIVKNFVEFQQLIYPERFDYIIHLEEGLEPEKIMIPPMLLQPLAENAIRHGLLMKKGKGLLTLDIFSPSSEKLVIRLSDNGIGIRKAEELQKKSQLRFISRSRELTEKRTSLLNDLGVPIQVATESNDHGTIVTINIRNYEK